MIKEFRLPDLGEGLTESEIVAWKVAVGDTVALNQIIAEVETAKAVVELPSPFAGVVAALHEQPGTVVEVGKPIVSFEVEGDDGGPAGGSGRRVPVRTRPPSANRTSSATAPSWRIPAVRPAAPAASPPRRFRSPRPPRWSSRSRPPRWSSRPRQPPAAPAVRGTPAVHAAGAQAGQGSRRRPRGRHRHGGVRAHHPRRRPQLRRRGRPAGGTPGPGRRVRPGSGAGAGRAGNPDAHQGRTEVHRRRHGLQRLHRAARHGVPDHRRHPDHGTAGEAQGQPRVCRLQADAADHRVQGRAHRPAQPPHAQHALG